MTCGYCGRDGETCTDLCARQLRKIEERAWEKLTARWFEAGPLDGTRLAALIAQTVPEANERARFEAWFTGRTRKAVRRVRR